MASMFTIHHRCPNCRRDHHFNIFNVGEYLVLPESKRGKAAIQVRHFEPDDQVKAYGSATCPNCLQPVLFVFQSPMKSFKKIKATAGKQESAGHVSIKLLESYPPLPKPYSHPAFPEKIKTLFSDLQQILDQGMNPSLIVGGCRSVLEVAVKALGAEGRSPFHKIDNLKEKGVITQVLADWGHHVRLEGNEAIHELSATKEEAEQMVEFTKVFLEYTFVLPYKIESVRKK
jgi:Domain of unknown function (DUF4145)